MLADYKERKATGGFNAIAKLVTLLSQSTGSEGNQLLSDHKIFQSQMNAGFL